MDEAMDESVDHNTSTERVEEAVRYLTADSQSKRKRGNVELSLALGNVENHARKWGLMPDQISQLGTVAASLSWGEAASVRLVKCLIPAEKVPQEAVVMVISWMCTNVPSSNLQSVMLRWILLVIDLLDGRDKLHSLYGILFYFIENETLCPHVCHLLYLLTRRQDVKLFRVRLLLLLQQKMGSQPHILGLLSLYKLYHPSLVSIVFPRTKRVFFRQHDHAWRARIQHVQGARSEASQLGQLTNAFTINLPSAKRAKDVNFVPDIQTASSAPPGGGQSEPKSLSLHQVKDFTQLLQCLDLIEIPSQVASVLKNVALQHMLSCRGDRVIVARLSYWLSQVLYEEFLTDQASNPKFKGRRESLLQLLIYLTDFLQEGIPVVDNFVCKYLYVWNGKDFRPYILRLVSRIGLIPFETLNDLLLEPLRKHFFTSSVYFKCQLIASLTELVKNYVHIELPRYRASLQSQADQSLTSSVMAQPSWHSVFSESVSEFDAERCIIELAHFTHDLCTLGLLAEEYNTLLFSFALSFVEMTSTLQVVYGCPCISLPVKNFVYMALFSNNAMVLSRLCHILCSYRDEFQVMRQLLMDGSLTKNEATHKSLHQIREFNPFVLDVSDCLWRYKAFAGTADSVFYKLTKTAIEKLQLGLVSVNERFSLAHHPATISFAYTFLKMTQPPEKKVHPSLLKDHKDVYLEYLSREHLGGIVDFVHTYIKKYHKQRVKES